MNIDLGVEYRLRSWLRAQHRKCEHGAEGGAVGPGSARPPTKKRAASRR